MCKEPKTAHIIRVKLTKPKFFGFLNRQFATTQNLRPSGKSFIAERLQGTLDLPMPLPFGEYADQLDQLINRDYK